MLLPRVQESEFKAEQDAVMAFVNKALSKSAADKVILDAERLELLSINESLYNDNQESWAIIGRLMLMLHKHQHFLRITMDCPNIANRFDADLSKAIKGYEDA